MPPETLQNIMFKEEKQPSSFIGYGYLLTNVFPNISQVNFFFLSAAGRIRSVNHLSPVRIRNLKEEMFYIFLVSRFQLIKL